eukprot:TRINITY_DN10798_c0_g1_i4.p1 TRINITY_DN10798_c0_g1~~TRINITY_DN10798_c0_g1_i4.p1  ORF type:complete len:1140 (+),score=247.03 TRINITY_DN10798_c0_g1_i4:102-3521(+)
MAASPEAASPAAGSELPVASEASAGLNRLPGGGPAGKAPLVRALRGKPDLRRVACQWMDRFAEDRYAAVAELVSLVMVVADVPSQTTVMKEDLQDREPAEVVRELTAALALEANLKGADFTQHWLVSREKGAQRVRDNFPAIWRELAVAPTSDALLQGLLQLLRSWTLALAECQFRSIRHAATVAGLAVVEGLGIQYRSQQDFCTTAEVQIRDAEAQQGGHAGQDCQQRLASLRGEHQHVARAAEELCQARNGFGAALLSRRTKDVDPEIRRSCLEALGRWVDVDPEACLEDTWTRYLSFALNDREPKVRAAALTALHGLLRGEAGPRLSEPVRRLGEQVQRKVLERCQDVDAFVGAKAIRCATSLAALELLPEDQFDPVVDLIWDPDARRRGEAAAVVSCFVFTEDILDYPSSGLPAGGLLPAGLGGGGTAKRRVLMLLQFVEEYADGHYELVERLVAALWRRASCLEDWEVLVELALPATEAPLASEHHSALIHLAEATVRLASKDMAEASGSAHACAVLDRAARAVAPKLAALLTSCQAEPMTMRRATSLCSHLLYHCIIRSGTGASCDGLLAGTPGEAAAEALKAAFMRQPDPEALEHIALALSHLLDLCAGARPRVRDLASSLAGRFKQLAEHITSKSGKETDENGTPVSDSLFAVVVRLRILAKAFDVSLCDLEGFVAMALGLVEDRVSTSSESPDQAIGPQMTIALLELLMLVLIRHAAALLQPEPLARCVTHDPIDQNQLKIAPTAAEDLLSLSTTLLEQDPCVHVRSAAFSASLALVSAWWNGAHFAVVAEGEAASHWVPSIHDELSNALCRHLSDLLTEANSVPADCSHFAGAPAPGDYRTLDAVSRIFDVLQQSLTAAQRAPQDDELAEQPLLLSDHDRIRLACLVCAQVASSRHNQVAAGPLPALVLSQGLAVREDLQEAAWVLLRRLRTDAHLTSEKAETFFFTLLRAVEVVHQDNGSQIARDLSLKVLQHVGVGKLVPTLQSALVSALRAGVVDSVGEGVQEGLLEALTPWVTKHVVEDGLIRELAGWAESQAASAGQENGDVYVKAGLPNFLQACRVTTERKRAAAATENPTTPQRSPEPPHSRPRQVSPPREQKKRPRRGAASAAAAAPNVTPATRRRSAIKA